MPRFTLPAMVLLSYPLLMGGCIEDFLESSEGAVELSITDAPADLVDRVRLVITAVELVSEDRGTERFDFSSPVVIDNLLDLQGGATRVVLDEDGIPVGSYQRVRLFIHGGDGESLVREDAGGEFPLFTPGQSTELAGPTALEVSGSFEVEEGETRRLVVDVDLRRGLVLPSGASHYVLLPALRLLNRATAGSVSGTVVDADLGAAGCTSDLAADEGNAVYVYAGSDAVTSDIFLNTSGEPLDNGNPLTVVPVTRNGSGDFAYTVSFLAPGDYTLALTCQGLGDLPLQDEVIGFLAAKDVSVGTGAVTVDF